MSIEAAENEGMPTMPGLPDIPVTVEQTHPGENHIEMMEMLGGLFVMTSRIYDCLMAMLPDDVEKELDELHSQGRLAFSPAVLVEDAWSEPEK